jgi:hypothetical protein
MAGEQWPFVGTEALAAGQVTRRRLRSGHEAIYRNVYLPKDYELTPVTRAAAAWLWSDRQATVAGLSAAALHGSRWIDAGLPAELNRPGDGVEGIVIHRDTLCEDETCRVMGMPATTPARTAFDLGRRKGLTTAVIRLDALSAATGLQSGNVQTLVDRHRGARGIVALRRVLNLMDGGAESPQETRTRLVLMFGGLPRPRTQIWVRNEFDYPFARVDMGYEEWLVGVEFDGAQHWTDPKQRTRDIDRYAKLQELGWRIVRVSADMLRDRPGVIVARTRAALRAAGWPGDETRLSAHFSRESVQ